MFNATHHHDHYHYHYETDPDFKRSLRQITLTLELLMSAVSDFAAKQKVHNDKIDAAITGLQGDVQAMTDLITKLQTTPGPISPEDQASLDELDARNAGVAQKLEALDALTPPAPPTE